MKNQTLLLSKLDFQLTKKLLKCYIWSGCFERPSSSPLSREFWDVVLEANDENQMDGQSDKWDAAKNHYIIHYFQKESQLYRCMMSLKEK